MVWLAAALTVAGTVPLAAVVLWRPAAPYWFVACGLSVSWIGDLLMRAGGWTWEYSYLWLPVQIGLVLWGLARTMTERTVIAFGVPGLAIMGATMTSPQPDVAVTLVGSVAILHLADGRLALPLYIYFGAGTVFYFLMAARAGTVDILPAWIGYQACRVACYSTFARSVYVARQNAA